MKLGYGLCSVHERQCRQSEVCEKFSYNELREKLRKDYLYLYLEQALTSITQIIDIIKEKEKRGE